MQLLSDLPNSRERKRQEFELQVTLAVALMESKGHVHPEVTEVLGHARSLIAETGATGTILHFSVLYGLWVAQYLGGERTAALQQANEFLSLAESQTQSGLLLVGHRLVGSSLIFTGNYPAALSHLDRAVALYQPGLHQELAFRFGADMGITAMCSRALALWHRGYFDQARKAADEGLRQARESTHRHTLAYGLVYAKPQRPCPPAADRPRRGCRPPHTAARGRRPGRPPYVLAGHSLGGLPLAGRFIRAALRQHVP